MDLYRENNKKADTFTRLSLVAYSLVLVAVSSIIFWNRFEQAKHEQTVAVNRFWRCVHSEGATGFRGDDLLAKDVRAYVRSGLLYERDDIPINLATQDEFESMSSGLKDYYEVGKGMFNALVGDVQYGDSLVSDAKAYSEGELKAVIRPENPPRRNVTADSFTFGSPFLLIGLSLSAMAWQRRRRAGKTRAGILTAEIDATIQSLESSSRKLDPRVDAERIKELAAEVLAQRKLREQVLLELYVEESDANTVLDQAQVSRQLLERQLNQTKTAVEAARQEEAANRNGLI